MLSRTPFYSLALFTSVLQIFFGFLDSFIDGRSPLLYIFGKIAGAAAIATIIWIGILFRYNNRPLSTGPLTRSLAHFTSFIVLCLVWLGIGIMLVTQVVFECKTKDLWCAASTFSAILAFLTSTFSGAAAILIWLGSKHTGAGLSVNVAQINSRAFEHDI